MKSKEDGDKLWEVEGGRRCGRRRIGGMGKEDQGEKGRERRSINAFMTMKPSSERVKPRGHPRNWPTPYKSCARTVRGQSCIVLSDRSSTRYMGEW
uniref:Uncharacterized protein n=1 Tax=Heterorhabditis bacteriophora TaxID=37862 RepID=A0A1I7XJ19_HETBA